MEKNKANVMAKPPVEEKKDKPQVEAKKPKPKVEVKHVFRGEREKIHALFELKPAIFKNNISFKFFEPKIQKELHKHHFHSIDRKGLPMNISSKNVGHYHYMEIENVDGEMKVKCGPPYRKVTKRIRGKDRTVEERIFYGAKNLKEAQEGVKVEPGEPEEKNPAVIDDHTHDVEYFYSEKLKF